MGSAGSCEKCTTTGKSSVINLSDTLVNQLLQGTLERDDIQYEEDPPPIVGCSEDLDWIDKLKCIDESHSLAYGLTMRDFNMLVDKLFKKFTERMKENKDLAKGKNIVNDGCTLNCSQEVHDYVEQIDIQVYKILAEKRKDPFMEDEIKKCRPEKCGGEEDDDDDE